MHNTLNLLTSYCLKPVFTIVLIVVSLSMQGQVPNFLVSENPACLDGQTGFKIIRFSQSGNVPDSSKWVFNTNNLSEGTSTTFGGQLAAVTYSSPGVKNVRLTAYYNGNPVVIIKTITIFNSPKFNNPGITTNTTQGCAPLSVSLRPNLQSPLPAPIDSVFWFYGDGTSDTVFNTNNVSHEYTRGKKDGFDVFVLVKDRNGCSNSFDAKNFIIANIRPVAEFSLTNTSSCTGSTNVGVSNLTSPLPLSDYNFTWQFPGGTPSSSTSPNPGSVAYAGTGEYVVRLTATNKLFPACQSTFQSEDTIVIGQILAGFTTNVSSICAGQSVEFTNTTNFSELKKYTLNFGGGTANASASGTFTTLTRVFNNPGTFTVSLTVESLDGCSNTITKQIQVFPKVKAGFKMPLVDSIGCSFPHSVNPLNTSVGANKYTWKWGNGQTSSTTPFVYQSPPSELNKFYDVTLIVESANGCKDSVKSERAVFIGNPRFSLKSTTINGCSSPGKPKKMKYEIVNLIAPSNAGSPNITWNINGGTPSSANGKGPITVDYPNTGSFGLNISFNYPNCPNFSKDTTINVASKPQFSASVTKLSPEILCPNETVTGTAFSATPGIRYEWLHGDGSVTEGVSSAWGYSDPKISNSDPSVGFPVSLIASKFGCSDTIKLGVARIDFPLATFSVETSCINKREIKLIPEILTGAVLPKDVVIEWDFDGLPGAERSYINNAFPNPEFYTYPLGTKDYAVTLTVTNPNSKGGLGCFNSKKITGRLVNPIPNVSIIPNEGCAPLNTTFLDNGLDFVDIKSWNWIFGSNAIYRGIPGDSLLTRLKGVSGVLYPTSGVFNTQLVITDINNCVTRFNTGTVRVNSIDPQIKDIPRGICPPKLIDLNNLSTVGVPQPTDIVEWFVNGVSYSTNPNEVLNIVDEGEFIIQMKYKGAFGCEGTVIDTVTSVKTTADFTPKPSQICPGKPINFKNISKAFRLIRYEWDFGDPNRTDDISSEENPTWTYNRLGTYTVTLKVFDENGCQDEIRKDIEVANLSVDFDANNKSVSCPILITKFTIDRLSPASVNFKNIKWELDYKGFVGGRVIFNNESPIWVYTEGGKDDGFYNVRLTVEDSSGCTDTVTKSRFLFVGGPRGDFSFNPKKACIPQVVNFDNSLVTDNVISKFWDWGNGTTSQVFTNAEVKDRFYDFNYTDLLGRDTNNNLSITGIVKPLLIIDDQICNPVIIERGELRLSELTTDFEAPRLSLCDSGYVSIFSKSDLFTESGDTYTSFGWSIPKINFTSSDTVIENLFLRDTGIYQVNFVVKSDFGCNDDTTFNLSVLKTPRLIMPPNPTVCVGDRYTINAPGALVYDWNPKISIKDPNTANPTVSPVDTTTYYVFFYSNIECPNNDSITVNVIRDLRALAFPDTEICIGDSVQIFATFAIDTANSDIKPTYLWLPNEDITDNSSPSPFINPTQDKQYTVTISYGNCPDDSYTLSIDVGSPPSIKANEDKTVIKGESTLLGAIPSNSALSVTWRPANSLDNPNILSPSAQPKNTTTYIVQIKDGACIAEDSMTIFVLQGCDGSAVKVPNVFSPNGDGKNDVLTIFGKGISDINYFRIYNRWGELVHESFDLSQGWDGFYNGKLADPGVYVYYLDVLCVNGENSIIKGNVTLLR